MQRFLSLIHRFEDWLLTAMVTGMIILAAAQILLRNVFETGFTWADPMLRLLVLWVGLLGALSASRTNKHISIDVFSRLLSARAQAGAQSVTALFTAGVSGLIAYHAARFVAMDYDSGVTGVAGIPAWTQELIIPLGFGLIALRYVILMGIRVRTLLSPETTP